MTADVRKRDRGMSVGIALLAAFAIFVVWQQRVRTVHVDSVTVASPSLPDMRVNINAATAAEISQLPGLGPKLAQRIVDDRDLRGPFRSIEDMKRVSGIGPAIVDRISQHAVVE